VYVIDAGSGTEQWKFDTGGSVSSAPAVASGTVYVGNRNGTLYALDAERGTEEWSFRIGSEMSAPVVANGTVYVGAEDGLVYALSAAGEILLSTTNATISQGGQASIDIDAESVDQIRIEQLWTDWTVSADVPDSVYDDSNPGEVTLSWDSDQSSVSPTLSISPPDRYVGGTFVLVVTASNSSGESVQTTATLRIE